MATDRYVCLSCHKGHDTPGLCPHCPRGELLDMNIPSDRVLLEDRKRLSRDKVKRLLLTASLFTFYLLGGVGVIHLVETQPLLGGWFWNFNTALLLYTVGTMALLVLLSMWHHRGSVRTPSPEQSFSAIDPMPWESLLDAPVPLESTDTSTAQAAPRPRWRERDPS